MTAITLNTDTDNKVAAIEKALIQGDLAALSESERISYYSQVCESVGLNPFTKPFEYIKLNGRLTLYALKTCTDQLRKINNISITKPDIVFEEGLIVVSITAQDRSGRQDSDIGAVALGNLQGEARANAIMKAITKAKRRVTLSICGLGMLDETEVETIPNTTTGEAAFASLQPQTITDNQRKRLYSIATKEGGFSKDGFRRLVEGAGFSSSADITRDVYDTLCDRAKDPKQAAIYNSDPEALDVESRVAEAPF